ncbi:MAG: NifU N-terminal domain-containing protein [Armatimonadota bacterium]|nr:NifU N-terminal domain-containing protein [Armatimonadota bacterium]MDR7518523.1 NifU N-terminal domain-containing protein [Armatimonadota bacterium]MDR7550431.1 NifU N-terminal domain-containing protein [Armatimonadota bacterium]
MAGSVTVEVQPTPNVNALKFVVNRRLTEGRSQTFRSAEEAARHPLAAGLFAIPGVVQVFLLNDFVTVTRDPQAAWEEIVPPAEAAIRAYLERP